MAGSGLRIARQAIPVMALIVAIGFILHMEQFERRQFQSAVEELDKQLRILQLEEEELSNRTTLALERRAKHVNQRNVLLSSIMREAAELRALLQAQRDADMNLTASYVALQNVTSTVERLRRDEQRYCRGRRGEPASSDLQHMRDLVVLGESELEEIAGNIPRQVDAPPGTAKPAFAAKKKLPLREHKGTQRPSTMAAPKRSDVPSSKPAQVLKAQGKATESRASSTARLSTKPARATDAARPPLSTPAATKKMLKTPMPATPTTMDDDDVAAAEAEDVTTKRVAAPTQPTRPSQVPLVTKPLQPPAGEEKRNPAGIAAKLVLKHDTTKNLVDGDG